MVAEGTCFALIVLSMTSAILFFLLCYQTYILDDVCCKVMTDRVYLKVIVRTEIDGLHTRTEIDGLHTISLYVLYFVQFLRTGCAIYS